MYKALGVSVASLALVVLILGHWALGRPVHWLPVVLALVVWHGDGIELERHSHPLALQMRLAGWLLVIAALHGANWFE